jgi:pyruvate/2-oxoglutarate dehydrogenase complex dihydrolipoamide acyltransferase (E2) component
MGYIVKMPKLGMDMDQGTVVEWLVEEGDEVTDEQVIAEIESEKTVGEIRSRQDGVLHHVLLAVGESTEPGGDVAIIGEPDEDVSALLAEAGDTAGGEEADTEATAAIEEADTEATAAIEEADTEPMADAGGAAATPEEVKATPRAKRRAEELGVDLVGIEGTGPQGAVSEDDVEAAAEAAAAAEPAEASTADAGAEGEQRVFAPPRVRRLARELSVDLAAIDGTGPGGSITESDVQAAADETATEHADVGTRDEERPSSGMRKTIATRLGQSYREAVHVTEHRTADAEELLRAADAAEEGLDTKVSVNDVLLLALSATLDEHPAFNATFEDDVHRLYEAQNICVAVDIEAGLVAPVVRDVGSLSLVELAETRRAVTERALTGEYTMDDLSGGTFTVSNLGVLGVESFDPVINPPQVAILGVNAVEDAVVPVGDGEVGVRKQISFDLSFDHRIVDGADAARFLGSLVAHVEDPWPLVVAAGGR